MVTYLYPLRKHVAELPPIVMHPPFFYLLKDSNI